MCSGEKQFTYTYLRITVVFFFLFCENLGLLLGLSYLYCYFIKEHAKIKANNLSGRM